METASRMGVEVTMLPVKQQFDGKTVTCRAVNIFVSAGGQRRYRQKQNSDIAAEPLRQIMSV